MRAFLALFALLAGCGDRAGISNQGPSENQIARLSTPKQEAVVDRQAAARPQPLALADLEQAGMGAPACEFGRDGRRLFAVSADDAVARIGGAVRHFAHASPAGPTGGFFEDRQVSVSVGRVDQVPPREGAAGSWPARLTVTNRRADAQVELEGIWRCGA
jgi:hypothetical protein